MQAEVVRRGASIARKDIDLLSPDDLMAAQPRLSGISSFYLVVDDIPFVSTLNMLG